MPWKETDVMSERMRFVVRLERGETMSALCREFGISRKTGYKILRRYEQGGPEALYDYSRKPLHSPYRVAPELEARIVALRKKHSRWGPKKLRAYLQRHEAEVRWPATSTFGQILKRHDLVAGRKRRRRAPLYSDKLRKTEACNQVWCADYKGQFRLGNQRYCYPLTITDQYSRYLLGCEALEHTRGDSAKTVFASLFARHGLPEVIRTDNGAPFASTGLWGLTPLSTWWIELGIVHERIEPAHPEQNGAHERMHRTLKAEATRPPGRTLLQQQERFDAFQEEYNEERPHEALDMKTPSDFYRDSARSYPSAPHSLRYPLHDLTRTVGSCGRIHLLGPRRIYLSRALRGQSVGLRELDDGTWLVSFTELTLGTIDSAQSRFEPADVSFSASSSEALTQANLLPMSPV
jgi:transposase InsO family protein